MYNLLKIVYLSENDFYDNRLLRLYARCTAILETAQLIKKILPSKPVL